MTMLNPHILRWSPLFRKTFPYCLTKLDDNRFANVWLPLNRNYKPLGILGSAFVDYKLHIGAALIFYSDPHNFAGVWEKTHSTFLYLYNDGTDLSAMYFPRLQNLLLHKHCHYSDRVQQLKAGVVMPPWTGGSE